MKLNSFNYLVKQGFSGIWKNKGLSFASFCIMLVSLLMVGMSALTSININKMIDSIADKNEIVIVIKDDTKADAIAELGNKLRSTENIQSVILYPKDEAWSNFIDNMSEDEKSLFKYSDSNPFPDTYRATISDLSLIDVTTEIIRSLDNVEEVQAPSAFADILLNIRKIVTIVSTSVVFALIIVSMVIISNATRESVFARRKEINIMKYVGATNAFIKVPFFVEGMALGAVSALGALGLTKLCYDAFFNLFADNLLVASILGTSSIIPFSQLVIKLLVGYLVAGVFIGAFGTVFSTRKHLKV